MNKKYLEVRLPINEEMKDIVLKEIDEELLAIIKDITYELIEEKETIILSILKNRLEVEGLKTFSIEGKILKTIGLKYNIFTEKNYLSFFKIKNIKVIETNKNNETENEINKYIAKVPKNDPLLIDVLNQLKKIKIH